MSGIVAGLGAASGLIKLVNKVWDAVSSGVKAISLKKSRKKNEEVVTDAFENEDVSQGMEDLNDRFRKRPNEK